MSLADLHKAVDEWYAKEQLDKQPELGPDDYDEATAHETETVPVRKLPEGKRVVRTKSSGDRVYMLDDAKKTRQWITNPEVLKSQGFEMGDVTEVSDNDMLKYQMGPALYRVADE